MARFFDAPMRGHDLLRHSIVFRPLLKVLQCFFQVESLAGAGSSLTAEERGKIFPNLRVAVGGGHLDNVVLNPRDHLLLPLVRRGGVMDAALKDIEALLEDASPLASVMLQFGPMQVLGSWSTHISESRALVLRAGFAFKFRVYNPMMEPNTMFQLACLLDVEVGSAVEQEIFDAFFSGLACCDDPYSIGRIKTKVGGRAGAAQLNQGSARQMLVFKCNKPPLVCICSCETLHAHISNKLKALQSKGALPRTWVVDSFLQRAQRTLPRYQVNALCRAVQTRANRLGLRSRRNQFGKQTLVKSVVKKARLSDF